jgi:putative transposase
VNFGKKFPKGNNRVRERRAGDDRGARGAFDASPVVVFVGQDAMSAALRPDSDRKYGPGFDAAFEVQDLTVKPVSAASPLMSARAERWIQPLPHECLDRFMVFGEAHLRYLVAPFTGHYHGERPHQSLGKAPPCGPPAPDRPPPDAADVGCEERLAGLLKSYRRPAA